MLTTIASAEEVGEWVRIDETRGITVSRQRDESAGIPAFRGKGVLRGNVLQMLSLMHDVEAVARWAYGIDDAKLIARESERTDYIYLHSDVPWPIRDRDMVVRRDIVVLEKASKFRIELTCTPDKVPEKSGIVRVKDCQSTFILHRHSVDKTELDYVMSLDPAGHLPKWVGGWVAKHVPFRTLEAIEIEPERSAQEPRYTAAAQRWSAAL